MASLLLKTHGQAYFTFHFIFLDHYYTGAYLRKIAHMASTKIAFYIYYLLIISPGIHVYVYYMVFAKLLKEQSFLGRSHMGTLGAKTSQWRPLQVAPKGTFPTCHTLDTRLSIPDEGYYYRNTHYVLNLISLFSLQKHGTNGTKIYDLWGNRF